MLEAHKPDDCTSFGRGCTPNPHCPKCSHAIYKGGTRINDKLVSWEFEPYHGYTFHGGGYRPSRYPGSGNRIWSRVEKWRKERGLI